MHVLAVIGVGVLLASLKKKTAAAADTTGYVNGAPVSLDLVAVDAAGHLMRRDAAMAFIAMRAAAQSDGVQLVVESAFRTNAEQKALYDAYVSGERTDVAARPGYSNHQGGVAADLVTARGTNAAYAWLLRRAFEFGFYATVKSEPWHWEYRA